MVVPPGCWCHLAFWLGLEPRHRDFRLRGLSLIEVESMIVPKGLSQEVGYFQCRILDLRASALQLVPVFPRIPAHSLSETRNYFDFRSGFEPEGRRGSSRRLRVAKSRIPPGVPLNSA